MWRDVLGSVSYPAYETEVVRRMHVTHKAVKFVVTIGVPFCDEIFVRGDDPYETRNAIGYRVLSERNKNDEKPSGNAPPQDLPYRPSMRPLEIQRYGNLREILRNAFRNIRLRNVRLRLYMQ